MASSVTSYLPAFEGLLPKWLLLVSVISVANSIQAYATLTYTQRVYNNVTAPSPPKSAPSRMLKQSSTSSPETPSLVTPLSARTFGTWTFLSSIIRLYAAYHIDEPLIYQLALWTYGVAWAHFMSEWWVFGTTRWGKGLAGPVFVSSGSLMWMWLQWGFYVKG
ncbi:ergosterol biosynthesis protein-like protein [Zopfia rhizophila CBS 207.26]|uniref:Ergosterol biosynthesis protein-like protein n=1 Tax=Zopfia rhizophila CBS 207.26 TaxID=1314779 RepID=A0A6A6EFB8_9PEZI|nr:ergosterol biosynthesis protein-like protein [Zopfia rhizophila CBS 207.26]